MKQQISPEVLAAWDRGDKIDAIRLLRQETGLGLKEAKEALESGAYSVDRGTPGSFHGVPANAAAEAAKGNLIEAIKLTRESTGLGLKEAKALVESHPRSSARSAPPPVNRGLSPGEVPRSPLTKPYFIFIALVAVLTLLYVFFGSR